MWLHYKVFICESGLSYCVNRTLFQLFKIRNQSTRFSVYNIERSQGICNSISLRNAEKDNEIIPNGDNLPAVPKKKRSRPPSRNVLSHLKQFADYYNVESIPKKYMREVRNSAEGLFIVSNETARTIVENFMPNNFNGKDVPLFEVNPGIGLLTKAFLEKGVHKIHILQSTFWSSMSEILKEYPHRIHMYEYDFFSLWKYMLLEITERDEHVKAILAAIKSKNWSDGPALRIFAAVPKRLFINQLIASIIFQKGMLLYGRAELYLIMRPYDFLHFTCDHNAGKFMYRASSVLFQIICETTLLKKLPRKDFIPWDQEVTPKKWTKMTEIHKVDKDYLYLVKVVPHQNLFNKIGGLENLQPLWHFVRQSFMSRKNKVIPIFENWVPGCGPRLIFKGMTIFTEFGELSPSEVLALFLEFTQWPEYSVCSFLPSMETTQLKLFIDNAKDDGNDPEIESFEENIELDSTGGISNSRKRDVHKY